MGEENMPCLLWVDDVAIGGENYEKMQEMVDRFYEIARKCKIEFGMSKTRHMIVGDDPEPERFLKLGDKISI